MLKKTHSGLAFCTVVFDHDCMVRGGNFGLCSIRPGGSRSDYSDADVVVEGVAVGVHRCILAVRSGFFHDIFKKEKGVSEKEGKPKYYMKVLLPYGSIGHEAFLVLLSYMYTRKLKPSLEDV